MSKLYSRKLLLSLAGVALVALNRKLNLGLTPADMATIAGIIVGGVLGLSLPDAAEALRGLGAKSGGADENEKAPVTDSGSSK